MGIINAFGAFLSPVIYLTVLSFIAYLVGMVTTANVSRAHLSVLLSWIFRSKKMKGNNKHLDQIVRENIELARKREVHPNQIENEFAIEKFYGSQQEYDIHHQETHGDTTLMTFGHRLEALERLIPFLSDAIRASVPTLAVKLQVKNKDLYDRYEKDKSEAEFRLSIAAPLAVLSVQIHFITMGNTAYHWPWMPLAGIFAVLMLVWRGLAKRSSATTIVITALEIGTIESSEFDRLARLSTEDPGNRHFHSSPTTENH
ncbi:hypothetical protein [Paeniglutamicibacter sp. NPDC091659]|uniref:hypothetical protein n=1 Tax=Paeniglutamicibacter sp. NPDC091659 TaxID=3364389 RepID=UPI0037F39ADB